MSASVPGGEIKCLTALRGIAAMAVVIEHFSATAEHHAAVSVPSVVAHGYLAVDLFFVLSGFIMGYTYLAAFEANGIRAFPGFLAKRVARIVPLNVAVLFLIMLAGAVSSATLGKNLFFESNNLPFDLLANLLLLQGLGIGLNLNGPSWTISTEFAAYLIFPGFLWLMFNRRAVIAVIGFIIATLTLCGIASLHTRFGLDTGSIWQGLGRCLTQFTMGLGVYAVYRKRASMQWLARDSVVAIVAVTIAVFLLLRIDLFSVLPFSALILCLACNNGHAARLLSTRVPYFLGVVSYSIYLIHNMFRPVELELVRWLHPALLSLPQALAFALVGSLSVIPFSWLAFRFVERPGRNIVRRLFAGAQQ